MENNFSEREVPLTVVTDGDGRSLACTVECSFQIDGESYGLLMPVDTPVDIITWEDEDDEDETAAFVEGDELDSVFETARAVLAEQNLELQRAAYTLVVVGELPELDEGDLDALPHQDETEAVQLLASFYHGEREYGACVSLDAFALLAAFDADGQPRILSPEEAEAIEPKMPPLDALLQGEGA